MSCMHQSDVSLVNKSNITGNCVVINQCNREDYAEFPTETGTVRMFSCRQRGLTKSRNMAIAKAQADICVLCDDDGTFISNYESVILSAYEKYRQADIIVFKVINYPSSLPEKVMRLRFPQTMKVCSCQISFRKKRLIEQNIRFDELLGSGTGNGAEEELKFLLDSQRAGLSIWYVPEVIASVARESSVWFGGFDETFFENRGATTRYILGIGLASLYAVYYVIRKKKMYRDTLSTMQALKAIFRGIRKNKIGHQAKQQKEQERA